MAKKVQEKEKVEREFIVGLQALNKCPRPKRSKKAIYLLKRFMFKHFRAKPENVLISNKLNEFIWSQGREHVPKKLSVKVVFVEGKANVFLKGEKVRAKEEKPKEKKEEKLSEEQKIALKEKEKKMEEKRLAEKAAEKSAIKRGVE